MGCEQRGRGYVSFASSPGGRGGNEYVFGQFLFSIFLFSSFCCSYFPLSLFFAKIVNRQAGVGPDRIDAGGNRNASETVGEGGNGYVSCCFLFSTLFISFSRSSSFPIVYSTTTGRVGRGGAGQDAMGPTRAGETTRDRTGGQAGEKRR